MCVKSSFKTYADNLKQTPNNQQFGMVVRRIFIPIGCVFSLLYIQPAGLDGKPCASSGIQKYIYCLSFGFNCISLLNYWSFTSLLDFS